VAARRNPRMKADPEPRAVLVAVTRSGALQVRRLARSLLAAAVVVADAHAPLMAGIANEVTPYSGALSGRIARLFEGFDQLVFCLSVGAVVRLIAPHLRSKYQDPGVLAIDDAARFVIPVLSGHLGGANAYAERLADLLGATAVITTASDVAGTIAVDILGRELGWRVEAPKINLTRVAARLVDGEPVAFVQEAGAQDWWTGPGPLPGNIRLLTRCEDLESDQYSAVLLVTRREMPADLRQQFAERLVVYRPPEDQP